jgi:methylisocitrate lyase
MNTLFAGAKAHPGRVLRDLMKRKCVMLPGSFNGLVGRMVSDMGFEGTYLSGAALTASRGVPDIGLLSLESFA